MAKALWGNGAGGLDYKELRWKMRGQVSKNGMCDGDTWLRI